MKQGDSSKNQEHFCQFSIPMIEYECPCAAKDPVDCCYWIKFLIFNLFLRLHNSWILIEFKSIFCQIYKRES